MMNTIGMPATRTGSDNGKDVVSTDTTSTSTNANRNNNNITSSTINQYNILNLLSYIVNTLVVFGIGTLGWFNRPSNGDLSDKYQTLVTPSGGTFSIWSIIFLLQLLWCLWQFIPKQRTCPGVLAVHYNYIGVCIMQIGWTIVFSYEIIWASLLFMYGILYFLVRIHISLQTNYKNKNWKGYVIWQLPFSIHLGWIIAASVVNTNLLLVSSTTNYNNNAYDNVYINNGDKTIQLVQYYFALCSLIAVALIGIVFLLQYPVDLTIPLVLVWATWGILTALDEPNDIIINSHTTQQINTISGTAFIVLCVIGSLTLIKIIYVILVQRPNYLRTNNDDVDDDDDDENVDDDDNNNTNDIDVDYNNNNTTTTNNTNARHRTNNNNDDDEPVAINYNNLDA